MSKRTFASRTFAPRHFNSATWTGEGTAPTAVAYETARHILYGTSLERHTLHSTSLERHTLKGATP
jgi:hypothetical protein